MVINGAEGRHVGETVSFVYLSASRRFQDGIFSFLLFICEIQLCVKAYTLSEPEFLSCYGVSPQHINNAAGDCPGQMHSPQQGHFQIIQAKGGIFSSKVYGEAMRRSSGKCPKQHLRIYLRSHIQPLRKISGKCPDRLHVCKQLYIGFQ